MWKNIEHSVSFPGQRWLCERTILLCYTYTAYLVNSAKTRKRAVVHSSTPDRSGVYENKATL
jgi:hypothetical protein